MFSFDPIFPPIVFSAEICIGQSVKQTEGTVTVIQHSPLWINCSYELSSAYQPSPFWYIQRPGLPPEAFLSHLGNVRLGRDRGFEAKHEPNLKTFHMQKSTSQLEDSAVYFCAVSHTVSLSSKDANPKRLA
ncbi:hypothetical protein JRQ81_004367 [Phrynocephalus forsythii]|uniref:Ig-like domain-containing protein n=1 Tax=Phrynocephalus forsythii TaxID=171643 RepID=A0A9Q0XG21_9SAUR|nr:hypothetical protein JRQ81_004367 [Phrynocephalus forsythii]